MLFPVYLNVLEDKSDEEQFIDAYNTYKRLVYHTAYKVTGTLIWQRTYCKRCFCTLQKIFLKFVGRTDTNSQLISLVAVEAVHTICFAGSEKNR